MYIVCNIVCIVCTLPLRLSWLIDIFTDSDSFKRSEREETRVECSEASDYWICWVSLAQRYLGLHQARLGGLGGLGGVLPLVVLVGPQQRTGRPGLAVFHLSHHLQTLFTYNLIMTRSLQSSHSIQELTTNLRLTNYHKMSLVCVSCGQIWTFLASLWNN